jgi:hypothetical protein
VKIPKLLRKEHRAPVVTAVMLTFFAWNAVGFGWFGLPGLGFMTAGGAQQLATAKMQKVAVPLAARLCAIQFSEQPAEVVAAKGAELKAATYTYARGQLLDKEWVTLGDNHDANQKVIDACADLILAAKPQKAADLTRN